MFEKRPLKTVLGVVVLLAACGGAENGGGDLASGAPEPQPMSVTEDSRAQPEMAEGFAELYGPYEEIGRALSEDRIDTVADAAGRLSRAAAALEADLTVELAGVSDADLEPLAGLLPDLAASAVACAESVDLETAREAFHDLSRLMVTFRDLQTGDAPLVAYCPMVDAEWLQHGEEIVNPYYGSQMLRCGDIVRR